MKGARDMRTKVRRLALGASVAATTFVVVGTAQATPLTSGVLKDAAGNPSVGQVRVYASLPQAGEMPLLGTAQAGPDGRFTVEANDPAQLAQLAIPRGGWLDYTAVGDTPGNQGQWSFTTFVAGAGASAQAVDPSVVARAASTASISRKAPAPRITIAAKKPRPLAQAAQIVGDPQNHCENVYEKQAPQSRNSLAVVGELNNAYNDGTSAKFTYGEGSSASSYIGVAVSGSGGDSYEIGGETYVADSARAGFPTVRNRYARKLRSVFEFTRNAARLNKCAAWSIEIKATSWVGGTDVSIQQPKALGRCDSKHLSAGFLPGSDFTRDKNTAVRFSKGAKAFGVNLTTRSGFDKSVTLHYDFRGRRGKEHWLCGADGKQEPTKSGRVYSGSR